MTNSSRTLGIWAGVVILIVAAVGGYLYYASTNGIFPFPPIGAVPVSQAVADLSTIRQQGNYAQVLSQAQSIQNDPNASNVDKAMATIIGLGNSVHMSGNVEDVIPDISKIKTIILDSTLPGRVRAQALNALAGQYRISGEDPKVFAEIYKNPPFNANAVQGNPGLSEMHLYEWSFSLSRNSVAAMLITSKNAEAIFSTSTPQSELSKRYLTDAKNWLKVADDEVLREEQSDPAFINSTAYMYYLSARAEALGYLAKVAGKPYTDEYRTAYDAYITYALKAQSSNALEILPAMRQRYASALISVDNDTAAAKVQLDLLSKQVDAFQNPKSHVYVLYIQNLHVHQPSGQSWANVQKLMAISPAFSATIQKLISTVPSSASGTSTSSQ